MTTNKCILETCTNIHNNNDYYTNNLLIVIVLILVIIIIHIIIVTDLVPGFVIGRPRCNCLNEINTCRFNIIFIFHIIM